MRLKVVKNISLLVGWRCIDNMEIDKENSEKKASDLIGKSQKKNIIGDSFKQKEFSDRNPAIAGKILSKADKGQRAGETVRSKMVSSASVEGLSTSSSGAVNSAVNGQAGGQNSQHGGGQSQLATGGALFNNLNVLQTLVRRQQVSTRQCLVATLYHLQ